MQVFQGPERGIIWQAVSGRFRLLFWGLVCSVLLCAILPTSDPKIIVVDYYVDRTVKKERIRNSSWSLASLETIRLLQLKVTHRLERGRQYHNRMLGDALNSTELSVRPGSPRKLLAINEDGGRLGNFIFRVASLIGVARKNGYIPVTLMVDPRTHIFSGLNLQVLTMRQALIATHEKALPVVEETTGNIYSSDIDEFTKLYGNRSVVIKGYLQTWKYFDQFREEIRAAFTFKSSIYETVLGIIQAGLDDASTTMYNQSKYVYSGDLRLIGIHVRRGDMLDRTNRAFGYIGASVTYLLKTIRLMQETYERPVFYVVSDDIPYCRDMLKHIQNVRIVEDTPPEVDMALLSLMDSVIITVGSFGWWGAYLSESSEIFYYKNWPAKNSKLEKRTNCGDYFLPYWQGRL